MDWFLYDKHLLQENVKMVFSCEFSKNLYYRFFAEYFTATASVSSQQADIFC